MEKWPIGVFASIDAGFGVKLEIVRELGIHTVHLHTPHKNSRTPENAAAFASKLREYAIEITTLFLGFEGDSYASIAETAETVGLVPPATRNARIAESKEISDFAKLLGVSVIGTHIGFVPHDKQSREYTEVIAVTRELCDHLERNAQRLHLETGQESAEALLDFLMAVDRENLYINFDPANLILYGIGDPLGALRKIGHKVRGVHCKDAVATTGKPGIDWGSEVPFGTGQVDAEAFLRTLKEIGYEGPLTIERELSEEPERQKEEIIQAVGLIRSLKDKFEMN